MTDKIVFSGGTSFDCLGTSKQCGRDREWLAMYLKGDVSTAKAMFGGGVAFRLEWESLVVDKKGNERTEVLAEDLSAYCVPGDLVDHRDDTITVYMGKPTELEKAEQVIARADALATAVEEVAEGTRPVGGLADAHQAYKEEKAKHKRPDPEPPGGETPKPKPKP